MKVVLCTAIAVFLHIVLGWQWTILAGILCSMMSAQKGWLKGALCVASGWGILVLFNYLSSPEPVGRMLEFAGSLMGNLPGAAIVVLTLVIGGLLGMFGGMIGTQLVALVPALRLYRQPA